MNKKLYLIIIVVVAAALVWWWWSARQEAVAPLDTSDISRDLEGVDVNNLDAEFKQIDQDLNNL